MDKVDLFMPIGLLFKRNSSVLQSGPGETNS